MPRLVVVDHSNNDTAAAASIEDLAEYAARVDAHPGRAAVGKPGSTYLSGASPKAS